MSTDVVIKNYLIPIPALDHRELSSLEMFHIFRDGVSSDDNVVVKSLQDCHHLFVRNPYVLNGHTQKYFRIPQFHSLQLELDPDVLSYLLRCTSQDVPDDMGTYQGLRVTTSGLVVRHMSFSEFPLGDLFCFALWIRQTIVAPLDKDPAAMQLSLISCWFMNLHDLLCFLRELQFDLLVAWNIQLKEPLEAICQHANTIKVPALSMTLAQSYDISMLGCLINAAGDSLTCLDLQICRYFWHQDLPLLQRLVSDPRIISLSLALQPSKSADGYQLIMQTIMLLQRADESQPGRQHRSLRVRVCLPRIEIFRELMPRARTIESRTDYLMDTFKIQNVDFLVYNGEDEWYLPRYSSIKRRI